MKKNPNSNSMREGDYFHFEVQITVEFPSCEKSKHTNDTLKNACNLLLD